MTKPRDRVGAIIIKDKKLLLVSGENQNIRWTPGGRFGDDETPEQALERELDEELGVKVKTARYFTTSDYTDSKTGIKAKSHFYFVDIEGELKPASEIDEIHWYSKEDFTNKEIKAASATVSSVVVPMLVDKGLL
jgi:8-oxo-dGTP diphosphatase